MSVYVDDMKADFTPSHVANRKYVMCHMIADTRAELLTMADRIGVARKWIQKPGQPFEHFDICLSKRALAIRYGAKEVSRREIVYIARNKSESSAKSAVNSP
jgi:hypothetical protein